MKLSVATAVLVKIGNAAAGSPVSAPPQKENAMTSSTGPVQLPSQSVIDGWTATLTTIGSDISASTNKLSTYIQGLLAQLAAAGTPIPEAQVSAINAEIASLQAVDTALSGLVPAAGAPVVTAVADTTSGGALADAGGDSVTVTGTGFTGASAVNFGSSPATSFQVVSDTSITAVAPSGTSGETVDVTVVTPAGTSATSAADQLSYA
jgi:hypothetical protein